MTANGARNRVTPSPPAARSSTGAEAHRQLADLVTNLASPGQVGFGAAASVVDMIGSVARRARSVGLALDTGPVATVPTMFGDVTVADYDRIILPALRTDGVWEFSEAQLIGRTLREGMVAVDIGAHVGTQSLVAARAVAPRGWVVALEPEPRNFALLCRNLERNSADNVIPFNLAATDVDAQVCLFTSPRNTGDHRVRPRATRDEQPTMVPGVRLDDVLPPLLQVDLVKTDCQGMDHRVLRGMERTLARWRPVVIAEYWPKGIDEVDDDPVEVVRHYREIGYRVSVLDYPGLPPDSLTDEEMSRLAIDRYLTLVLRPRPGT